MEKSPHGGPSQTALIIELSEKYAHARSDLDRLQAMLSRKDAEIKDLKDKVDSSKLSKLVSTANTAKRFEKLADDRADEILRLGRMRDNAVVELHSLTEAKDATIAKKDEEIERLKAINVQKDQALARANEHYLPTPSTLLIHERKKVDRLEARLKQRDEVLQRVKEKRDEWEKLAVSRGEELNEFAAKINELEKSRDEYRTAFRAEEADSKTLRLQVAELEARHAEHQDAVRNFNRVIEQKNKLLGQFRETYPADTCEERNTWERRFNELKTSYDRKSREHDECYLELEELKEKYLRRVQRHDELIVKHNALQEDYTLRVKKYNDLDQRHSRLRESYEQQTDAYIKLRASRTDAALQQIDEMLDAPDSPEATKSYFAARRLGDPDYTGKGDGWNLKKIPLFWVGFSVWVALWVAAGAVFRAL